MRLVTLRFLPLPLMVRFRIHGLREVARRLPLDPAQPPPPPAERLPLEVSVVSVDSVVWEAWEAWAVVILARKWNRLRA